MGKKRYIRMHTERLVLYSAAFCIPGMVMCTKVLLDVNKEPTDEEIKYAFA